MRGMDRRALARRCLAALDLTLLDEDADRARVEALCDAARTPFGAVAAVCVHPEWIATCRARVDVPVATVVNFPDGSADADRASRETRRAIAAGAREIDLVFPYRAFLAGDVENVGALLRTVKSTCASRAALKVILESGVIGDDSAVRRASALAIEAGADFLKTSTGKTPAGATPEAARAMLETIRSTGARCGFKASGGVRDLDTAAIYFALADSILGAGRATPARFRIGASALLTEILATLSAPE